jgi:osmotically-inducible protein OsmY
MHMARYEEERYGGQRGSTRRGGYNDRGRDDDLEQQERDRYRSSEYGRDYGGTERGRGGSEGWRNQEERDSGRSLGGRESYDRYDEDETYGSSYSAGGREGNRYGGSYDQGGQSGQGGRSGQGRWGSQQRYGQGSQGYGGSQGAQGYGASQGYQGSQGYGQPSGFYGQGSQRYGQGISGSDEGMGREQRSLRGDQGSWGGQPTGRGNSMQADGWSAEPDEMRWGRQQGLYGSSEYGGYISSQRSQADYQSHAGKGPKGWQRSDERIREEVNEALARHPEIDASEIEVRVEKAEVTLTGTVDDRRTKRLAEDIVERVFGVKEVENKVKVKGRGFFGLGGDRDVTTKADRDTGAESQETRRTTAGATTGTTSGSPTR